MMEKLETRRHYVSSDFMRPFHFTAWVLGLNCVIAPLTARDHDDRDKDRPRSRVIVYEHADFRGASTVLEPGESIEDLTRRRFPNGKGMNDSISSIRIEGAAEVLVFQDTGFRGGMLRISHSLKNLHEEARGWNDAISALRVERERGGPPPRPDRPDFSRVDPVIRRAYLDILLREPDASGLRSYRSRMIEDGWTEARVRAELRETREYRSVVERLITKAYRELLGRAPDPAGRRMFTERMLRDGWTEEDVRNAIRKDDEYRRRPRPPRH